MSKNKSRHLPVLSIAFVTGEEIEPRGLPKLIVYASDEYYLIGEGEELIKAALIESLKKGRERSITSVKLAVEIYPMSARPGRRRRLAGGVS